MIIEFRWVHIKLYAIYINFIQNVSEFIRRLKIEVQIIVH